MLEFLVVTATCAKCTLLKGKNTKWLKHFEYFYVKKGGLLPTSLSYLCQVLFAQREANTKTALGVGQPVVNAKQSRDRSFSPNKQTKGVSRKHKTTRPISKSLARPKRPAILGNQPVSSKEEEKEKKKTRSVIGCGASFFFRG